MNFSKFLFNTTRLRLFIDKKIGDELKEFDGKG